MLERKYNSGDVIRRQILGSKNLMESIKLDFEHKFQDVEGGPVIEGWMGTVISGPFQGSKAFVPNSGNFEVEYNIGLTENKRRQSKDL